MTVVVSRISRPEIVAACRKRFGRRVPDQDGVRSVYYDLLLNAGEPWDKDHACGVLW